MIEDSLLNTSFQVALQHIGLIAISGTDAKSFLQGQLSNDLDAITQEQYQFALYANLQGRVMLTCRVFYWENQYTMAVSKDLTQLALDTLGKYAVFSQVTLQDVSQQFYKVGVYGTQHTPPQTLKAMQCRVLDNGIYLRLPGQVPRYEYYTTDNPNFSLPSLPEKTWRYLDIIAGHANVTALTSGQFIPLRINHHLIDMLSFTKGCYLGQEIIARLHYRGTIKHHARLIRFAGDPLTPGEPLQHPDTQQNIAYVIDSVALNPQQCYALISIADAHINISTLLHSSANALAIQWLELPYPLSS
jgi:tRNA-modifying protein YgfZ